jgi:hypothetical protein
MEFWFVKNVSKYLNRCCISENLFLRFSCNFVVPNLKNQNVVLIGVPNRSSFRRQCYFLMFGSVGHLQAYFLWREDLSGTIHWETLIFRRVRKIATCDF